jgi:hypothetical protein
MKYFYSESISKNDITRNNLLVVQVSIDDLEQKQEELWRNI